MQKPKNRFFANSDCDKSLKKEFNIVKMKKVNNKNKKDARMFEEKNLLSENTGSQVFFLNER